MKSFIFPLQHDADVDSMTLFDDVQNSRATGTIQGVRSEAPQQSCNNHGIDLPVADQEVLPVETPLQHGNSIQQLVVTPQKSNLKVDSCLGKQLLNTRPCCLQPRTVSLVIMTTKQFF